MTEDEWLTSDDCCGIFRHVRNEHGGFLSVRKNRLVGVAICRRIWSLLSESSRNGVEVAELFADGAATADQLYAVWKEVPDCEQAIDVAVNCGGPPGRIDRTRRLLGLGFSAETAAETCYQDAVAEAVVSWAQRAVEAAGISDESAAFANIARDIFGNPFRPVVADAAWLTPTVVSIADAIYRDRAFDRLPILADALEEAGCTNSDLLLHCRQPGDHVRGCWAVDLVLGKE